MKKKLKEMLSLNSLPCSEASAWAEQTKYSDPIDLVISAKSEWREWVAKETNGIDTLQTLSADQHWSVRRAVANNANTPIETLQTLSADQDWGVRYAVANNKNFTQ